MPTRISRYCEGLIEAGWLAALALVPLFFNIYSSRIFEPDKIALLRSLALVILAAWLVKLLDENRLRWKDPETGELKLKGLLKTPLLPVVIGLGLLYLVSTLFSVTPRASLMGSYQRLQGTYTLFSYLVIFAAIAGNLRRQAQVERLVTLAILTSLPVTFYGLLQRYALDPVPWGGDTVRRIAANLGNSIFVAAYLIMIAPLTLTRLVQAYMGIWKEENRSRLALQVLLSVLYGVIALLQVIAIYLSGSRGPALGWMAGMYVLALLLALRWRKRLLSYAIIGAALVLGVFLFLFNLQGGPLEGLRTSPAIGRFGLLLDSESNSARVRRYIWQGAARMVAPHEPLEFPDGSRDRFNFLRPLIGYGPESMYVAYNPFYPPELGQVERRNASPDRAHNETWDALVITGVLGFVGYLAIFLAVFYYALKWIGLIDSRSQRLLFWLLTALGGLAGAAGLALWSGPAFIGVGIPFGIALGLMLYLFVVALRPKFLPPGSPGEAAASLTLIGLVSAVMAHFVEINFGIAIAATRTYFWAYAALILAVGYFLPRLGEYAGTAGASGAAVGSETGPTGEEKKTGRESRKAHQKTRRKESDHPARGWQESLPGAGLLSLLLVTLGYNYLSTLSQPKSVGGLIINSLTLLPRVEKASSGILLLVVLVLVIGAVLLSVPALGQRSPGSFLKRVGITGGISAAVGVVYWLLHSSALLGISQVRVSSIEDVNRQVGMAASLLTGFYVFLFLLLFGLAYLLQPARPAKQASSRGITLAAVPVVLIAAVWLVQVSNLRVIQADIIFKMAEGFNRPGQWAVSTRLYRTANAMAPLEDYYYLFLGRNYLELAKESEDPLEQEQLVREAQADLEKARRLNPLNTDHTANLGRLFSWWAAQARTEEQRRERALASSEYYATALTLSPQNSTLWGEWAMLYLEQLNDPEEAHARLVHALDLDDDYSWTQGLMGDYYAKIGRSLADPQEKSAALQEAARHYNLAAKTAKRTETQIKVGNLVALAGIHLELQQTEQAIEAYEQAVAAGPRAQDLWRIQETLARLYGQSGQKELAKKNAAAALTNAPEDQTARLQALLAQLETLP